jgi:hypothetical protein
MSKTFRAWKIDEPLFLPPTAQDFVAEDHLSRFVLSLVRDDLGLAEITRFVPFAAVSRCSELSYETGQWSIRGLRPKSKTALGHPAHRP